MRKINHRGFTLIELISAITIAVVLASAIYGTLNAGLSANKKGYMISEKNQIARAIIDQIRSDLLSASVSSTTPSWAFTATTLSTGSTYTDTLQFVNTNQYIDWSTTGHSDEAIITYAIDTIPDTAEIGLMRTINRHITDLESTDLIYQLISKEVVSLHFQYYDGYEWLEEWQDPTILPKAVTVSLGIRDPEIKENINWYVTSLRLPKA